VKPLPTSIKEKGDTRRHVGPRAKSLLHQGKAERYCSIFGG